MTKIAHLNGKVLVAGAELSSEMTQVLVAKNGNIRMSFSKDFYPSGQDRVARAKATASRIVAAANTIDALVEQGLEVGVDFTAQDTYRDQQGNYKPSLHIWLNAGTPAQQQVAAPPASDEDLILAAMEADESAAMTIIGDSEKLSVVQRARLRKMSAGTAAGPDVGDGDNMPLG
jgi:hypothetical protein